jgi:hypothetical protein
VTGAKRQIAKNEERTTKKKSAKILLQREEGGYDTPPGRNSSGREQVSVRREDEVRRGHSSHRRDGGAADGARAGLTVWMSLEESSFSDQAHDRPAVARTPPKRRAPWNAEMSCEDKQANMCVARRKACTSRRTGAHFEMARSGVVNSLCLTI